MTNEQSLRDVILEHIDEKFCENCPAWRYESDTGAWYCPCLNDVTDSECYRNSEWQDIENELDKFLENIRQNWPSAV